MADNELDLMQWQIGTQSQFDTAVTPTAKLMGVEEGEIQPTMEISAVPEQRGTLVPAYNASVDFATGEASLSGAANFEQLGYMLDSLLGQATPSGANPYTRAYAAPIASKPDPRILTLFRGNSLDGRSLKGAIANEVTLTAETNTRLMYEAKFIGHSVEADEPGSLSDVAVEFIHSNQVALYLDVWGGTMGATALNPIAMKYELGLNMNNMVQMGLGSITPRDYKIKKGEPDSNQLKLGVEVHSDSISWLTSILTATTTPFRAQIAAVFTSGSKVLTLQYAGYAAEAPKIYEDADGIASLEFTFSPMYHTTFGNWFKTSLVNTVSSLA
jgi:hypothetical protein